MKNLKKISEHGVRARFYPKEKQKKSKE